MRSRKRSSSGEAGKGGEEQTKNVGAGRDAVINGDPAGPGHADTIIELGRTGRGDIEHARGGEGDNFFCKYISMGNMVGCSKEKVTHRGRVTIYGQTPEETGGVLGGGARKRRGGRTKKRRRGGRAKRRTRGGRSKKKTRRSGGCRR